MKTLYPAYTPNLNPEDGKVKVFRDGMLTRNVPNERAPAFRHRDFPECDFLKIFRDELRFRIEVT
jgi:hypothetical protein